MIRVLLLSMLAALCPSFSCAQERQPPPPVEPRDELRYDGQTFLYWQQYPRTELKAERRMDAVRAMAAFGSRGYAREAAAVIVDMLMEYDNDKDALCAFVPGLEKPSPDQRILQEAVPALRKIGSAASVQVLGQLDHAAVHLVADQLYKSGSSHEEVSEKSVPVLVHWALSKNEPARDLALSILYRATREAEPMKASFLAALEKEKGEQAFVELLRQRVEKSFADAEAIEILGTLGPRARAALPVLVRVELNIYYSDAAVAALKQIKPEPAERVAILTALIKTETGDVLMNAAGKLAELGDIARGSLDVLKAELEKPLRQIPIEGGHGSGYYQDLQANLKERMALVNAFVKIAGKKEAIPVVAGVIARNSSEELDRQLVQLYLTLDDDPKQVVAIVTRSLEKLTAPKKVAADNLTPGPIQSGPYLGTPLIQSGPYTGSSFKQDLIAVLGKQGKNAKTAVPLLLKTLDGAPDYYDGIVAVVALGKIGPDAAEALPKLRQLAQSVDVELRRAAVEAIEAISKK